MSQVIISGQFVQDLVGQGGMIANPPANTARFYYSGSALICIDSTGANLLTGGGGTVTSVFTRTGAVVATTGDYAVAQVTGAAPLASPTFTGTPAAPTAAPGTNTTQLASTAFVTAAIGAGVVSVTGTTNQINVATGTTTPVLSLSSTLIIPGIITIPQAGALSQSAVTITGAPIATGGTGTTTFPLVFINGGGTASTTWKTTGTILGILLPTSSTSDFFNFFNGAGATQASLTSAGVLNTQGSITSQSNVSAGGGSVVGFAARSLIASTSNGLLSLLNNAQNDFTRLNFGGVTTSFPGIGRSGTTLTTQLGDGTSGGTFAVSGTTNLGSSAQTIINSSGLVTKYNNISTISNGVPSELATVDVTAQTAAIAATTLYAVPAAGAGMYRISWSATITTAGTTSILGGTNSFQAVYTSSTDSVVKTTVAGNSVTSAANTTGTAIGGSLVVYAKASTNIQYQFDYTSSGTAMQYELHVKLECL